MLALRKITEHTFQGYISAVNTEYGENSTPFIQKGRAEEINSKLLGLINSESPLHHFMELPKT